jgi:hypothetical protein
MKHFLWLFVFVLLVTQSTAQIHAQTKSYTVPFQIIKGMFLFAVPTRAQPKTYTIPFHESNHMILLDTTIDGKPAVLILDTGAAVSVRLKDSLVLGYVRHNGAISFRVAPIRIVPVFYDPGISFDGFLGSDLLRRFSSVRIDYVKHVVELTE